MNRFSKQNRAWRLIKHGQGKAEWNMAVDEAMMRAIIAGETPPSLRLYQWEGFAISVGRFQSIERTMRVEHAAKEGLPIVRRVTGGRGILHGDDLTISIACNCSDLGVTSQVSLSGIYTVLMGILRMALGNVGVKATQGVANRCEQPTRSGDCFAITSHSDLVDAETSIKLLGGALHRSGDAILFQASAPLHTVSCKERARDLAERVFRGDAAKLYDAVISPISRERLEETIVSALCTQPGATVAAQGQTDFETNITNVLQNVRYSNVGWRDNGRSIGDLDPN